MYVLAATLWTLLLITQMIDASFGNQPTWFDVFIPLTCMALNDWVEAAKNHR